jgi:adenosylcobinamide-GDP ribazoletransferase
MMNEFWLALSFLTTIPTPAAAFVEGGFGRLAKWFPWVGLILGLILAGSQWLLSLVLPAPVTAVLIVALWAWLTGGLHLDGLADCGDGLLAAVSRERRLEILKDSRLGAFGAILLVLFLLAKGTATSASFGAGVVFLPVPSFALILAPVLGRWFILIAARQPSARPGGMGDWFAASLTPRTLFQATILPLSLVVAGGWYDVRTVWAALLAGLVTFLILRLARSRLGGVTGDVFGLVVEMTELAVLLAFAVQI